jgi:elongator complex protein 6
VGKAPSSPGPAKRLHFTGRGQTALDTLEKEIVAVIDGLKQKGPGDDEESEVLLVIDQPDLLLAATGPSQGITATEIGEWVMGLQQVRREPLPTKSDGYLIYWRGMLTAIDSMSTQLSLH